MRKDRSLGNVLIAASLALIGVAVGWHISSVLLASPFKDTVRIVTIDELRSKPGKFAGRSVQLGGQLNECFQWKCSLCPEVMKKTKNSADQCLALSFHPLIDGTGFGSAEQEAVFRFASVVLTAKFDPSCWKYPCLDRQVVLENAQVLSVTKRRPGAVGVWMGDTSRLIPIHGSEAGRMIAAARRAGYSRTSPVKAFSTIGADRKSVVCWSSPVFGNDDPGSWPATFESALYARSTLDFFRCNEVRKIVDQFVLQVAAS